MVLLENLVPYGSTCCTRSRRLLDITGEKMAAVTARLMIPMGAYITHRALISQHLFLGDGMRLLQIIHQSGGYRMESLLLKHKWGYSHTSYVPHITALVKKILTKSFCSGSRAHSSMRYCTIARWPQPQAMLRHVAPESLVANLLFPSSGTKYLTQSRLPLIAAMCRALFKS